MSKLWLVAERQLRQEVLKRGFLLALLSLPLFLGATVGIGLLFASLERPSTTLGYVDQAGMLQQLPALAGEDEVAVVPFTTAAQADIALRDGSVDAYVVIGTDFPQTRQAQLYYVNLPDEDAMSVLHRALRLNLLADQPAEVVERALFGPNTVIRATDRGRDFNLGGPQLEDFLPAIAALLFSFLVLTVSSTLMQALVSEKENRTLEIVVTSVSTGQMMAGKIVGVLGMTIILAISWIAMCVGFVWIGGTLLGLEWLQDLSLNWRDMGLLAIAALPSFLFICAFMVTLGATLVDVQEAQQAGGLMFLAVFLPIYLFLVFARDPNGPVAIAFSMFPITAVPSLAIRSGFMQVPAIQYLASAAISLAASGAMIWLAGKAIRLNMLRYGQRLRLGQLLGRNRRPLQSPQLTRTV